MRITKAKNKSDKSKTVKYTTYGVLILLAALVYLWMLLLGVNMRVLNPMGFIAQEQFKLIVIPAAILLTIGIPSLFLFYYFAWKYREANTAAVHDATQQHGRGFVVAVWAIPCVFALVLSAILWPATQRLEPHDAIASDVKPMTIEVVAMRWKWLFIYPEQRIATVNHVQIPVGTPIQFELTADEAPMSSFWVPQLGGQLYAMTGHVNRLNLIADRAGDYAGSSAEINGAGFAGMKFVVKASTTQDFATWVRGAQSSPDVLDAATYADLLKPSENNPSATYVAADPDTYAKVLMKYMGSHDHGGTTYTEQDKAEGHDDAGDEHTEHHH